MKYHRVSAQGFKIHVSDRTRAELGGEAALESLPVQEQLASRMNTRDYGADCPAEEQAENAISIAADYGPVTGFYRCAAAPQVIVLSRQRPSPDHNPGLGRRVRRNQSPPWLTGTPPPYSRTLPVAWPPTALLLWIPAATPGIPCGCSSADFRHRTPS